MERAILRGDFTVAVVRKDSDLNAFGEHPNLRVVVMDFADTQSVERGFAQVDQELEGRDLKVVVHCAAISGPGAVEITSVEKFQQVINTNTLGSLRLLKQSIPRLRGHGGRVVLVTSLWGQASGPLLGAYCASKHAIESLADTLRRETRGMNLHVVVAEPGVVQTDMLEDQASFVNEHVGRLPPSMREQYENLYLRYHKLVSTVKGIDTDACSEGLERAMFSAKPRLRYQIGGDSKIVCFLNWLLPARLMDFVMGLSLNNKALKP
ncbi:Short-chain dehydrogenase [Marinobacter sp. es.048]|nr:Short-chain dehydrogenase [Marinobacter sp. es.048]